LDILTACRDEKLFGEFFRDPASFKTVNTTQRIEGFFSGRIKGSKQIAAEHWKAERRAAGQYY
jgi:hypothetical protein